VFGWLRPVLFLPEGIEKHLSAEQLEGVIAHEISHVRRRDNLFAAVHALVEAVFWFHPLVWWIGARLLEERERACDEEVLAGGSQPIAYAEGILRTCRLYLEWPAPCMSGVTGADLKERIVRITSRMKGRNLGPGQKALLVFAGALAITAPVVLGLLRAPGGSRAIATGAGRIRSGVDQAQRSLQPKHVREHYARWRLSGVQYQFEIPDPGRLSRTVLSDLRRPGMDGLRTVRH
jgi:hypothetical protein